MKAGGQRITSPGLEIENPVLSSDAIHIDDEPMIADFPQQLVLFTAGAFLLGWLLSAIASSLGRKNGAQRRDPRDGQIRGLGAELRIARAEAAKSLAERQRLEAALEDAATGLERRDEVITEQQERIARLRKDLKESVIKTRELRAELTERATENVHAEAKIREVETELSVVQASSDLIATGVLDYGLAPERDDGKTLSADEDGSGRRNIRFP